MGQVNIYKIAESKRVELVRELTEKLQELGTIRIEREVKNSQLEELMEETPEVSEGLDGDKVKPELVREIFNLTIYISSPQEEKEISWNWLLNEFNHETKTTLPNPKAVLLIRHNDDFYSVTFGFAYFLVDKYCVRNFAFNFARKLNYKEVKTTALTTPNSQKNKSIISYVNYNDFEFDSMNHLPKLKRKLNLKNTFRYLKKVLRLEIQLSSTLVITLQTIL